MPTNKTATITLKVDPAFAEIIDRLPNKSEFIRNAILGALENTCPLCQGTGVLSPEQKEHWESFTQHHLVKTCESCRAVYLECDAGCSTAKKPSSPNAKKRSGIKEPERRKPSTR
jgi:hypothetical protein